MYRYDTVDWRDACLFEELEVEDEVANWDTLQEELDSFLKVPESRQSELETANWKDLFWTAFMSCTGPRLAYDWLSSGKQ